MTEQAFRTEDVSVQERTLYRVWCAACAKWIGGNAETPYEPILVSLIAAHREDHAAGVTP